MAIKSDNKQGNPYHGDDGKFTSAEGQGSSTANESEEAKAMKLFGLDGGKEKHDSTKDLALSLGWKPADGQDDVLAAGEFVEKIQDEFGEDLDFWEDVRRNPKARTPEDLAKFKEIDAKIKDFAGKFGAASEPKKEEAVPNLNQGSNVHRIPTPEEEQEQEEQYEMEQKINDLLANDYDLSGSFDEAEKAAREEILQKASQLGNDHPEVLALIDKYFNDFGDHVKTNPEPDSPEEIEKASKMFGVSMADAAEDENRRFQELDKEPYLDVPSSVTHMVSPVDERGEEYEEELEISDDDFINFLKYHNIPFTRDEEEFFRDNHRIPQRVLDSLAPKGYDYDEDDLEEDLIDFKTRRYK